MIEERERDALVLCNRRDPSPRGVLFTSVSCMTHEPKLKIAVQHIRLGSWQYTP